MRSDSVDDRTLPPVVGSAKLSNLHKERNRDSVDCGQVDGVGEGTPNAKRSFLGVVVFEDLDAIKSIAIQKAREFTCRFFGVKIRTMRDRPRNFDRGVMLLERGDESLVPDALHRDWLGVEELSIELPLVVPTTACTSWAASQ